MVGAGMVGAHSSLLHFVLEHYQTCLPWVIRTKINNTVQDHTALLTPTRASWAKSAKTQLAAIKIVGRRLNAKGAVDSWDYKP